MSDVAKDVASALTKCYCFEDGDFIFVCENHVDNIPFEF